nr:transposase, MuDR, plant [Tanacetum cinerariifolium]
MINPCMKVKEIIESILKKYKCKVTISQARRGKMKALQKYETCLEDHYGMLWSYASEILNSNPGSTCKMSVDSMPDGKNYFSRFYICFKGLMEGWLQGCIRVIGIDGCFLKTICKGELLLGVWRDRNNQIYLIAWAVVNVDNKDNWSWFIKLLINALGLVFGETLTINIRHPESWSRAYFSTDKACDAVENRIFERFNALIVGARRKPIINMLEDIRALCMERLQKIKEKHAKWNDGICPNIRKELEKYKDLHSESRFEVRNGYERFKVDERSRTCSCRGWQLFGIPCEHGIVAIYFLHKDPKNYVFDWYNKGVFINSYNHYIEGMNEMDQCPTTDYQNPLSPIVKRMLERPPHKRKRDAMKDDGNRTKISRKGQLNHFTLCKKRHNQRDCPSKPERTTSVGQVPATGKIIYVSVRKVTATGGKVSTRGGKVTARGGIMMESRGTVYARARKVTASRGKVTAKGGKVSTSGGKMSARGEKVYARGEKVIATPSTPLLGFEMSTSDTTSSVVRTSRGAIKLRECVWIRSPKKERSSYADSGISSMNKLRTVNGKIIEAPNDY